MELGKAFIHDAPDCLSLSYEDYEVEAFGGSDYEVSYTLNRENRRKLLELLKSENMTGSLEEMIIAYFGECLEKVSFAVFCDEHGIEYDLFTWIS